MILFSHRMLIAVLAAGIGFTMPAAAEPVNKSEVEQIIEDYIRNNPEVILESVNDYQTHGVAEQQAAAIQRNARKLFQNNLSPEMGEADADIRIVEFFDYNCGYCKRVIDDVNRLTEGDHDIRVIFKEFPILGPTSETAARWALAAHNQGQHNAFHTALMKTSGRIDESILESVARDQGLDVEKLRADAQSERITEYLDENRQLAQELSITGTPAFIIEDEIYPGAIQYNDILDIVAEKRAEKAAE